MNNRCAIVLFCCLACLQAQAQAQCPLSGNPIRSVSVNSDGKPVIEWDAPANFDNAIGYIIYEYLGGNVCTDSIGFVYSDAPRSYTDERPDTRPDINGSRAYSIAIKKSLEEKGAISEQHAFSWLSAATYNPCSYTIDLQWTAYVGWESGTYNIYGGVQGTTLELLATTAALQFTHSDVPDNVDYEVYVEAVNADDPSVKSASNRQKLHTKTLQRPKGLPMDSIRFAGNAVELQFAIDNATQLSTFHIMRSSQIDGIYTPVHTFSDKTSRSYTDNDVHAVYYYRLAAENDCQLIAAQGNVLNNIDLRLAVENGVWHLSWNKLVEGRFYSLTRLEPSPKLLLSDAVDVTTCTDRIDPNAALDYCYQIEASTAEIGEEGKKSVTIACATYEPEVLMPDALNPKSTAANPQTGRQRNQFGPVLFIASTLYSYQLEIYDRNGGKVVAIEKTAADSPLEKSWTGLTSRGEFVPENMYLYRLELTFINGKTVVKTGNVAVLYD
jgi:hypothetical protein